MKFHNITNAFCVLEASDVFLICDPWIKEGIYDGSWAPYPPLKNPQHFLKKATHCYISHIHEDHFDLEAIEWMPKETCFIVPDLYPNHLIIQRLKDKGFSNFLYRKPEEKMILNEQISLEIIGPLNSQGLEYDNFSGSELAIDCGLLISYDNCRMVLLSDNTPYVESSWRKLLPKMKSCDLLAFNYNGAPTDFPLCYDFELSVKKDIRQRNEGKREKALLKFIEATQPKYLLPYSSEFVVRGPRAHDFASFHGDGTRWVNRQRMAQYYSEKTHIPAIVLYQEDHLLWQGSSWEVNLSNNSLPTLKSMADHYFSAHRPVDILYDTVSAEQLKPLLLKAADFCFLQCQKFKLNPKFSFVIEVEDMPELSCTFDYSSNKLIPEPVLTQPYVKCQLPSHYLYAILTRQTSWDICMASFQANWMREPNEYDRDLYLSVHFIVAQVMHAQNKN